MNTTSSRIAQLAAALVLATPAVVGAQQAYTTSVQSQTSSIANWPTATITRGTATKVVGGGARTNWSGSGNLLTQTQPGPGPNDWTGSGKDHLAADRATLTVYSVGLDDPGDDWLVGTFMMASGSEHHPVVSVTLPSGWALTGGGCLVYWAASPTPAGNLLTASFPSSPTTWECRSKDHSVSSPASISAYVVGIRPKKAGIALPVVQITTARSAVMNHPTVVAPGVPGWVVTGGGALALPADPAGAGQLLTGTFPTTNQGSTIPTGWYASSKDHAVASPGTVQAFAVSLNFAPAANVLVPQPGGVIGLVGAGVPLATLRLAGQPFAHCAECPMMKPIPAGTFVMGSPPGEPRRQANESPQRRVTVPAFYASETEVTWAQWDACVAAQVCSNAGPNSQGGDEGWGRGVRPAINMSWNDAQVYVHWLAQRTSKPYRLLTEAEWEYAARAGTTSPYYTGTAIVGGKQASGWGPGYTPDRPAPVKSFPPNPFGLYDMAGNVREWVEDCNNDPYAPVPVDGSAYVASNCNYRMVRDAPWNNDAMEARSALRKWVNPAVRSTEYGFRVALSP